jgi:Mrp family chromosome partitioning ATPase
VEGDAVVPPVSEGHPDADADSPGCHWPRPAARARRRCPVDADDAAEDRRTSSARDARSRAIAVANQKGGVGKTTTASTCARLAELGQRVDRRPRPQGNASSGLGIENHGLETSMYHVLMHDVPIENCIEPTDVKGLFVALSSLDLAGAEIELVPGLQP